MSEFCTEQTKLDLFYGMSEQEIKLFVGKNYDSYNEKWRSSKDPQKKAGWNWAAFLAGIFWLGYRKMYSYVLYFMGFFFLIDIFQYVTKTDSNSYIGYAVSAVLGVIGNSIYFNHMSKKIAKIKSNDNHSGNLNDEIAKAGGTSWLGVFITFLIFLAYLIISTIISSII